MLSYHHRKPNSKHADASRTCEISILPNGQSNTSITQIDQAHAIAQLMKKVKPSSSSKAHRLFIEYYQMPRKSVLTSILLLCAYLITIKNTPPTHRPRLFELTYNVLGSTFIACAYYFTLIVHSVEGLMALAICRYRQYSWSTTFLWTLQTLGIGFPGMQLLLKPRPAIKQ
ncbi:hypothetical protein BDF22DRAFT_227024 [Syncephalis plumigaleata]|nr:hypothetical protein BDF22DRAFT_227024 [Syncephalis plumigaleata]